MATYATEAIIIGRHEFGEADRVVILLTPDRGVIRGVSKGVRRIKSRLAGHLELFSHSDLMLAEGKNMDTITSARLKHHIDVSADYDKMRLAYLFSEMTNRLAGENENQDGLFELVRVTFEHLGMHGASITLELWFKLRLLDRLGYRPQLAGCISCGSSDPARSYYFNAGLGGLVDRGCSGPGDVPISIDQIKLWRVMLENSVGSLARIDTAETLSKQSLAACDAFYDYIFGRRFRSAEVMG